MDPYPPTPLAYVLLNFVPIFLIGNYGPSFAHELAILSPNDVLDPLDVCAQPNH